MDRRADCPKNPAYRADILLAVRAAFAVLITAPPAEALQIARVMASERGCSADLLVCDFEEEWTQPLRELEEIQLHQPRILLLRDVHDLTAAQQERLVELIEDRCGRRQETPWIIASSSVSLLKRVRQGSFDERLFYLLNTVHVVVTDPEELDVWDGADTANFTNPPSGGACH
jgi:hypothetical protein